MYFTIGSRTRGLSVGRKGDHIRENPGKADLQKALAALIRNTRTTRRPLPLTEIAHWLDIAVQRLGSINEVAERIGLSANMLRQFQYVQKLSPSVRALFAERKIDSVDAAVHLSLFGEQDQIVVAEELTNDQLDSADVRAIAELRKELPDVNIDEIIERITTTKNVKQYVVEFVVHSKKTTLELLRERFSQIIGSKNIVSITVKGSIGSVKMSAKGRDLLQKAANSKGITKAGIVTLIAKGRGGS